VKRAAVWIAVLLAFALLTKSCPYQPSPIPPGAFAFAAMGDAPYYWWEDLRFRILMRELDATDLRFTIHVGDIFWRPCSDAMYAKVRKRFDLLRAPVIYTPGDNEWTDCWEPRVGGYVPLERLAQIRKVFFSDAPRIPLARQPRLRENSRWEQQGIVFTTVHITGSSNAMKPFPGRTPVDDEAARERMIANIDWMHEAFASAANARALVIAFHGSPAFEEPPGHEYRRPFEPFLGALEDEVARFKKPVLLIHGDDHEYLVDSPVISRRRLPNFTRLEVPGSPDVGWVRVLVSPNHPAPFAFERRVVGGWKYW
jgi:hypothetical protein